MIPLNLSIAICSVRPLNCISMLSSLVNNDITKLDEIILIFDVKVEEEIYDILTKNFNQLNLQIYLNQQNFGLSYCRNYAMNVASNTHIIFFDDDVILPKNTISIYRSSFVHGYSVVGGPMKLPKFYPNIPKWLPPGYSSLLGIHTNQKKIWGANFGFKLDLPRYNSIFFNEHLGRKGRGLQSGDETDFLTKLEQVGVKLWFLEELHVYHYIELNRFKLGYLLRRSYWQGRSEVRKKTLLAGIIKEWKRAISIESSQPILVKCMQTALGVILFSSLILGVTVELTVSLINNTKY